MPTAEKAVKERDCTQMPVAKKKRTDHKCLWQRRKTKTQMLVANEKWLPLSGKQTADTKKNPPNHKSNTNRLLSATKEWTTTVIRLKSTEQK